MSESPQTITDNLPDSDSGHDPVAQATAHLELLSEETRETVLSKMDPDLAERIRNRIASTPDRPHGSFSRDVVARRRMLREMTERIHATNAKAAEKAIQDGAIAAAKPQSAAHGGAPQLATNPGSSVQVASNGASYDPSMDADYGQASTPVDPLHTLRHLHPAAIARAMQGERAEAWAIVLDRLDVNARAALQMYLDDAAQSAILEAKQRHVELSFSAPALVQTIEAAIARTVVPRAMREHQYLLSTQPQTWY